MKHSVEAGTLDVENFRVQKHTQQFIVKQEQDKQQT
jgi:hypothetical protein